MLDVLVVDDMIIYRKILTRAVESTGLARVKNTASNGLLALERLAHGSYDVVLMDMMMPEMDGLTTLVEIKKLYPKLPVIMISGDEGAIASLTIEALKKGAMEFVIKPDEKDPDRNLTILKNFLLSLFMGIRITKLENSKTNFAKETVQKNDLIPSSKYNEIRPFKIKEVDYVLIASSTGGPVALETVFRGFSKNFRKPVVAVQHLPANFTKVLADSLNRKSCLSVVEGENGMKAIGGQIIIAPGSLHSLAEKTTDNYLSIKTEDSEPVNGVKPSADVLFKSFAREFRGARVLAVILTGMGSDGRAGVAELREYCQCYCITQNEKTSVVYGMPKSVKEAGFSNEELDLELIAQRIEHIAQYGS